MVLRHIVGNRKILSPGIGAQGGDADAVARLVDGIIVGRAIYEADSPGTAAEGFARVRSV
jgi:orotidine-5'-phosphate decarboxylase